MSFTAVARITCVTIVLLTAVATAASAQWAQGKAGRVWAKTAVFLQQTDEQFGPAGDRQVWLGNGESDARALFTDVIVGLHPRIDFWLQVPLYDLRFDRPSIGEIKTTGVGDIRAWLRWQFASLMGGSTPVALRVGAKAPVGDSPLNAEIIPVGEGQWDVEAVAEIGHSFWPVPVYAELWLGYRARFANTEKDIDPGGEYLYLAEAGVQPTQRTLLKVTVDGLVGRRFVQEGIRTNTKRRIHNLQFAGAVRTGPVWPEFGVRIPVSGQLFPAGPQFVFALSTQLN
jgi:hypothetical protein